jgi:SWI/SNF-related matrix-associated actin-dependent regulator of chromatin subfamily D
LRVFISNTAHDQPWQNAEAMLNGESQMSAAGTPLPFTTSLSGGNASLSIAGTSGAAGMQIGEGVDVATGKGIAGWNLKIEGRLIDVSYWSDTNQALY